MNSVASETTDGVLNEVTHTVHRSEPGGTGFETNCGITRQLTHDNLRHVLVEQVVARTDVTRCGRCFPGAGGY